MPQPESTDLQPPPTPEQTPHPPASTPPATGAEYRYGDDAPEYLRGKSPQETVAWVTKLVDEVQQLVRQQPQPAASQPQPRTMQEQIGLPDPDLALTDPKGYQAQLTRYIEIQNDARMQQYAAPVFNQLATTAREMSKNDPASKPIWDKYTADIEQVIANVPAHARTKELYDHAVTMVKGRRFDELAAERGAQLAAAGTGLARGGTNAGADGDEGENGDVWEKIAASPMGKAALNVAGKKGIIDAVRSGAYKSLEDYAAAAAKSRGKVDPANPNIVRDYMRAK